MRTIIIYNRIYLWYARFTIDRTVRLIQPPIARRTMTLARFKLSALACLGGALLAFNVAAQDLASFKLAARDGVFEPTVIEVPAGKRFRLEIANEGKTAIEFESRDLKQEKVIPAGGKATVTINPLKAGEYKFFDEFHEKTGQGKIVAK
jgi:plastocyanin